MKKLICPCCGAPINREKRKCEYCGVEFEIEEDKIESGRPKGMPLLVKGAAYNSNPLENIKPKLLPTKTLIW